MMQPEMLRRFALHYKTGEPMPEPLLSKLLKARQFNQGWATVEYTASALVDLKLHLDPSPTDVDVVAFEKQELERLGMPAGIAMRHRTPHFQHIFSGGYSAAYYSYMWSEVLDADGFEAFEESGDIFDPEVAKSCTTSSTRLAALATMRKPIEAFAAGLHPLARCSASEAWRSASAEPSDRAPSRFLWMGWVEGTGATPRPASNGSRTSRRIRA